MRGFLELEDIKFVDLTRDTNNPLLTAANQNLAPGKTGAPNIYWPCIIKTTNLPSPIDNYYLYYSTDHNTTGGIYLATGPSAVGPWTGQGRVYLDTTNGNSTETPAVVWNEDEQLLFLYYHNNGLTGVVSGQTTCLATSTDGQSFTRVGPIVDPPASNMYPGPVHTGYFKPFRVGKKWYAYHLITSQDRPRFMISYSPDGRDWTMDPHPLGYGSDQLTDGRRIEWNHGDVIRYKNQNWFVGISSNFTSGATPKDARIIAAPIAGDMRHLLGEPIVLLYPPTGANESVNYRGMCSYVENDQLILYYQCDDNFNVAVS